MGDEKKILKEADDLSFFGKLFFAGVVSYLAKGGSVEAPKIPIKIRATKEQIKAIMDVISATKELQDVINKPDVPIETVIEKIKNKNQKKEEFFRSVGRSWPL
jgi:hypothetical protein